MLRFLWIHSTNVKGLALVSQNRLRLFIILGIESSKPRRKNVEPAPHNFCWLPPFLLLGCFFFCSFLWVIVGSNWQEFVGNYSSSSLHTHLLSPQAMNNDWVCKNVVAKNSHQILIGPRKNLHIIVTLFFWLNTILRNINLKNYDVRQKSLTIIHQHYFFALFRD